MMAIQEINNEIANFLSACILVIASLCYCYVVGHHVSKGFKRFCCIFPVICLFLYLPLTIHILYFSGPFSFFVTWLANFKLLLFAFGKGPLSSDPSISLTCFIAVGSFPIEIQQSPSCKTHVNCVDEDTESRHEIKEGIRSFLSYVVKVLMLAIMAKAHNLRSYIHPTITPFLYLVQVCMSTELMLAITATLARVLLGVKLEPQFNKPYYATSLQNFWGRRWNLMVSRILRAGVYEPTRRLTTYLFGRKWAAVPAVPVVFLVSGAMHDLLFYYYGCERPTGEITCFFLLHGVCVAAEIALKKIVAGRWELPWLITGPLTIGFAVYTSLRLFVPTMLRCRTFEIIYGDCCLHQPHESFIKEIAVL